MSVTRYCKSDIDCWFGFGLTWGCGCSGFVSGSAAQEVKFWEWAVASEEGSQARQLTVNNTRTLKMTEDVLCVRISPNGMPCRVHLLVHCLLHSQRASNLQTLQFTFVSMLCNALSSMALLYIQDFPFTCA